MTEFWRPAYKPCSNLACQNTRVVEHTKVAIAPRVKLQKRPRLSINFESRGMQHRACRLVNRPAGGVDPIHGGDTIERFDAPREVVGQPLVVAVEERDVRACCEIQAGVTRSVGALVGLGLEPHRLAQLTGQIRDHALGVVGAPIVDDDQFPVFKCLRRDRRKRPWQESRTILRRQDDADLRSDAGWRLEHIRHRSRARRAHSSVNAMPSARLTSPT